MTQSNINIRTTVNGLSDKERLNVSVLLIRQLKTQLNIAEKQNDSLKKALLDHNIGLCSGCKEWHTKIDDGQCLECENSFCHKCVGSSMRHCLCRELCLKCMDRYKRYTCHKCSNLCCNDCQRDCADCHKSYPWIVSFMITSNAWDV